MNGSSTTPGQTLVLKGSGGAGLGDRLLSLIVAIMYAESSGRRLYVDWADTAYSDGSRNYFGDLFVPQGDCFADIMPYGRTVLPDAWLGRLGQSLNQVVWDDLRAWDHTTGKLRYSFDQSRVDYPADVTVMWDFDQFDDVGARFAATHRDFADLAGELLAAAVFRKYLRLHPSIESQVADNVDSTFRGRPVIGVHVRLTAESQANRENPQLAQFLSEVSRLLRTTPAERVFLATDNDAVIAAFAKRFPGQVVQLDKWLPESGQPVHMNPRCPNRLQSARDALADAALLARCDYLVTSAVSGFSWMARIMSELPPARRCTLSPRRSPMRRLRDALGRAKALIRRRLEGRATARTA